MIGEISIDDFGYADDLGMLENTVKSATAKLQSLNQQSMTAGMEYKVGKTKAMHILKKGESNSHYHPRCEGDELPTPMYHLW